MKSKVFFIVNFFLVLVNVVQAQSVENFFNRADKFFAENIADGLVVYSSIKSNPSGLEHLTSLLEKIEIDELGESERKALFINAYNLFVIKGILKHYPLNSPLDIEGFFDQKTYIISSKEYSLNEIEKKLLLTEFQDERLHFVLVCGAMGCPPLANYAFLPDKIEAQINHQTWLTLNNNKFIRQEENLKLVKVSEIFKWYKDDFDKVSPNVLEYLNKYRIEKIPISFELDYYKYDWKLNEGERKVAYLIPEFYQSNIQTHTPSKLLKKGQIETQLFNNLYTQTAYRDGDRKKVENSERATYFTALYYFLIGVSENSKVNIGIDVTFKSVRIDLDTESSPLKVFKFSKAPIGRSEITGIGPKIKFNPFNNFGNFSIQSAFWIPLAKNLEAIDSDDPWLDYDRYTWWTQFFLDKAIGNRFQIFTEIDLILKIDKKFEFNKTLWNIPVSVFMSYFLTSNATLYTWVQYAPTFSKSENDSGDYDKIGLSSDYAQLGIGAKYQINKHLNIEASFSDFFTSLNGGAGNTYNFGVRYIL